MADINDVYALLQQLMDSMGADEGYGAGYGDSDGDGYADQYANYGEGEGFSLYAEVLAIKRILQEKLDAPISSREPALKTPGVGNYFVSRIVKDDTDAHAVIYNVLAQARYSGGQDIIKSTRTNSLGKFVLFFDSQDPVDIYLTSDHHQGIVLYGVIPQPY